MRIPSYDDLAASIPDVTARETFEEMEKFLPRMDRRADVVESASYSAESSALYACLRHRHTTTQTPPPDRPDVSPHFLVARDFSPRIERHGSASTVLDISGLGRLLGTPQTIGAELARAADGYAATVRIAIARSQTAARLLAIAQVGPTIADGDPAAAIASLPIDTLRVFIEDGTVQGSVAAARRKATVDRLDTFRRWGLATLGEIAVLPPMDLSERMGQEGLELQRLARGIDRVPLVPDPGVPRFIESVELEWPIDALEPLSFVFARLLDPLSLALERADRGAAAIRLDLGLVDRTTHSRCLQLPAAMRDAKVLRTLLLLDLESHPPACAIDVVTIEVDPVPGRIVQYSLLQRALPSPETLATLTARLSALVGDTRCGSPVLLDTWRPDGFELRRFAPSSSQFPVSSSHLRDDRQPSLHVPESAGCLAEAAQPRRRTITLILRRFRPSVAIRVTVERGRPVRVAIDRRGMPGGHVERASGPWRTSGAWWEVGSAAWDRDEWDAALSDGSVCRLFHDRIGDRWFLDGVLD
jgi:protein ImuB